MGGSSRASRMRARLDLTAMAGGPGPKVGLVKGQDTVTPRAGGLGGERPAGPLRGRKAC